MRWLTPARERYAPSVQPAGPPPIIITLASKGGPVSADAPRTGFDVSPALGADQGLDGGLPEEAPPPESELFAVNIDGPVAWPAKWRCSRMSPRSRRNSGLLRSRGRASGISMIRSIRPGRALKIIIRSLM